ncbi:MAG TPA: small ribosomal subunit Rsm22 family protein [Rectinemataceae bacterium]
MLDILPGVLDEVLPLSQRHRQDLGKTIRSLWEDLTSEREHRTEEYLGNPAYVSAYARYFLPWNLLRLSSILSSAPMAKEDLNILADIGSGPLSLPLALWASRPDLRDKALKIYCVDRTEKIMKAGQAIFESACVRAGASLPPWRIELRRQSFGEALPEKADLVSASNLLNEFFWKSKAPLATRALVTARQFTSYISDRGSILIMEPGDPRSGTIIAALRAALIDFGGQPLSPCPHSLSCPMPGLFRGLETPGQGFGEESKRLEPKVAMPKPRDKYPWCHFSLGTAAAPRWLTELSDSAGLAKDKIVFSYLLSAFGHEGGYPESQSISPIARQIPERSSRQKQKEKSAAAGSPVRVVSEAFSLPGGKQGRYACSSRGYCLVRSAKAETELASGDLLPPPARGAEGMDEKSGAISISY